MTSKPRTDRADGRLFGLLLLSTFLVALGFGVVATLLSWDGDQPSSIHGLSVESASAAEPTVTGNSEDRAASFSSALSYRSADATIRIPHGRTGGRPAGTSASDKLGYLQGENAAGFVVQASSGKAAMAPNGRPTSSGLPSPHVYPGSDAGQRVQTIGGNTGEPAAVAKVLYKLDPRLTRSLHMGDRWISNSNYTQVGDGQAVTVEAKLQGLDASGRPLELASEWTAANPDMIRLRPAENNAVKITVLRPGQSSVLVSSQGLSTVLTVSAVLYENTLRADIFEQP